MAWNGTYHDAGHRRIAGEGNGDSLPGYWPYSWLVAYRPLVWRDDVASFPALRPQTAGSGRRCNRYDWRPSGKSQERNLLDEETLRHNQECIKKQLGKFLDFRSDAPNRAELVNNYDWMKDFSFLDFARTVGKHITVNYMMAKESVQKRLNGRSTRRSFIHWIYLSAVTRIRFPASVWNQNCKLQLGGSDQWETSPREQN